MEVLQFTENNFAQALSNQYTSIEVIRSKNHFSYLLKYLQDKSIDARTILIEEDYVSKDFLHDYASYYAFCFEKYPKFCKRIHFFSTVFTKGEIDLLIIDKKGSLKSLWKFYIGFIVVKPIPVTVIGFTILKPYRYKSTFDSRNIWGLREYKIHLCGHEHVIESLVFQEQDSVVAACASTAIWTMLNKASVDFHTVLKSPSEITNDADNVAPDGSRLFPNKGLNLLQLCQSILRSGLVSEVKQPDLALTDKAGLIIGEVISCHYLKKILNSYSSLGVPIILIISVPVGDSQGLHAIAVSGYNQKAPRAISPKNEISFLADNIKKIYAHDDQYGPFVRIEFIDDYKVKTPWTESDPYNKPTIVERIIVPVYPKVRIAYEDIEILILGFDAIFTLFFGDKIIQDLVWDIKIVYSEKFKDLILASYLSNAEKVRLISKSMPRFVWLATCYISKFKIFEFSFDATDVSAGMIGEDFVCYFANDIRNSLVSYLIENRIILEPFFEHEEAKAYYDFLLSELSNKF